MQEQNKNQHQQIGPGRIVTVPPASGFHKHTIIWIHGLHESPEKYLKIFDNQIFNNFKIIAPQAPTRFVTIRNQKCTSWFDIKFRNQTSFKVDFDQAFSKQEVLDSYSLYLVPIIKQAHTQLKQINPSGKLIIAGFSQGCGMSLHSFYNFKQEISAVIGISGYLFPFTPFQKTQRFHRILYGKSDQLRPWDYVKCTYEGKIQLNQIKMVENTGHQINKSMQKLFHQTLLQIFGL